ncbi:PQQ-binding-like beta-propeller repeat protein [Verrucomicrobiales bacterium BCK34]|nr:PQQ-binding-like beta-propeller repeat protein [Verrucomicrobiales bacterium BCK34]
MKVPFPYLLLALSFSFSISAKADWPQFRGENADGISSESVPTEWSETKNMLWSTELPGEGTSTPVISGDAVFVTSFSGEEDSRQRHLSRLSLKTGDILWTKSVDADYPEDPARGYITEHGWASSTPVTDGEAVFCFFGKAGVYAFDFDGNQLWKARTGNLSSPKAWGSASSPILFNDLLIVPAGEESNAIIAFNKKDGAEKWRAEGDSLVQTYGTPLVVKVDDARTDLVFAAVGEIWGINPESGKLRWFAEYNLPGNMSNSAHLSGDIITVSGGYPRTARVALKVGGKGDLSDKILYDTQKPATYMTAPVEADGILYWVADSGIAFAAVPGEADELWQARIPDLTEGKGKPFYASPVLAGGKIYAQSRANGVYVIEPSKEELKVIAHNKIAGDDTIFNAAPAISDGKILLRSQKAIYCIGE